MAHFLSELQTALALSFAPMTLLYLVIGVVVGMILGIIPGFSGVTGMVILLPFVFHLDVAQGMALLLGMYAATTVTDVIPAVLLGVPGTSAAQAHVLDGYPMAKRGEADRALSAAYSADILGAVVGVFLFLAAIPLLAAMTMAFGSPEYFALGFVGICAVGTISTGRGQAIKGVIVGFLGILLSTVGMSIHTGLPRYTFGEHYLLDGLPIVAVVLGLFALPEIIELFARNESIAGRDASEAPTGGTLEGLRDTMRSWFLVVRSSVIGGIIGFVPAIGGPVAQWIAFGFAKQTEKNSDGIGLGDVRGIIAAQAAVSACKPGALIPTLVFGVPGDVVMAILLGAFLVLGIRPGPHMVGSDLDVTLLLMFIIILANVIAVVFALCMGRWLLKITKVEASNLTPIILSFMILGSLVATGGFADIVVFVGFGILGFVMDKTGWPRIPLILGFVLGKILETYLFISYDAYGVWFVFRPIVFICVLLAFTMLVWPALKSLITRKRAALSVEK